MKKLIIAVMACYGLNARAQMDTSKDFLYLNSDSVIYANKVTMRPDLSGGWQLRADSRKTPTDKVKFFNNKDGFFANTRNLNFAGISAFAERVTEGKINLYSEVELDPYQYDRRYSYGENRQPTIASRIFYNKGTGDLRRVNYRNLREDMTDNAASMDLLKGYRKSQQTSTMLYAAGGAAIVAGLISFMADPKGTETTTTPFGHTFTTSKSKNFTVSFVLLGIGTGLAGGGLLSYFTGIKKLERAVDVYNK
ncbi:hypothetical protein ACXZ1K_13290 [Pedobacter sp. PWIIR3]